MKKINKLMLIGILALNNATAQASVNIAEEFKVLPAPKNKAEKEFEQNIRNVTGIRLLSLSAVICGYRGNEYLVVISNGLLQVNTEYMNNLLKQSPSSEEYMWKVANLSDKITQAPGIDQELCRNMKGKPLEYIDSIYRMMTIGY